MKIADNIPQRRKELRSKNVRVTWAAEPESYKAEKLTKERERRRQDERVEEGDEEEESEERQLTPAEDMARRAKRELEMIAEAKERNKLLYG